MSGTSLDGLDLALCEFQNAGAGYGYKILKAETVPYSSSQKQKLSGAHRLNAEEYFRFNVLYGKFIAAQVNTFLTGVAEKPTAIASHGHTIFHQPENGFSIQAGCGATIAAGTGITTVCDFRSLDVALNGQGAPLVPLGDKLLFGEFESCLNIGGIANISFDNEKKGRVAFDICPANMAFNYFAAKAGKEYDAGGEMARQGHCNEDLLSILDGLNFYTKGGAKSLGREWFEQEFLPLAEQYGLTVPHTLSTLVHHAAGQVAKVLEAHRLESVLVTGGGAFNKFFIETLQKKYAGKIHIPDALTVNFKEALIFAFLGYLRLHNRINTLASVTGALRDSVGGAVYSGKN